jgi:hypothetical protein
MDEADRVATVAAILALLRTGRQVEVKIRDLDPADVERIATDLGEEYTVRYSSEVHQAARGSYYRQTVAQIENVATVASIYLSSSVIAATREEMIAQLTGEVAA